MTMGDRNRVGIGLSFRPARLHRQVESIPGILKSSNLFIYILQILTNWFLLGDGKVEVGPGVVDWDGAPLYLKYTYFLLNSLKKYSLSPFAE
jgi:hypothetical protein